VGLGLVVAAMGLVIVLLAVGLMAPGTAMSDQTPRWVGVCAGLAFVLAGAALIIGFAVAGGAGPDGDLPPGTPRGIRLTQYLLGLGIVGSLAAIASWIAFGPGPRTFTTTGPLLGWGPASETVGRAVFGLGAVLIWIFFVVFVVVSAKRLRGRK
jgi:hypothetical protein